MQQLMLLVGTLLQTSAAQLRLPNRHEVSARSGHQGATGLFTVTNRH